VVPTRSGSIPGLAKWSWHVHGTRSSVPHHDFGDIEEHEFIDYQRARAIAATTRLRRFAKEHRLTAFVSLAYSDLHDSCDLQRSTRHPERLLDKLRLRIGCFPYAIVAEFGRQDGKLHWHWLVPASVNESQFTSSWNWGSVDYKVCSTADDLKHVIWYLKKDFNDPRQTIRAACSICSGIPAQEDCHLRVNCLECVECGKRLCGPPERIVQRHPSTELLHPRNCRVEHDQFNKTYIDP